MSSDNGENIESYYAYKPNHVLPIVFAVIIGISLTLHVWQNFRYKYWRVTFFMFWGGLIFTTGWIMRVISSYNPSNLGMYSAQYVLILCGPPIYSAAEYNILGRLMHYVPMHAPLNPNRVVYFFIYLGVIVEGLTAAGAAQLSISKDDAELIKSGATLMVASVILQIVVELGFIGMVAMMHYRCAKAKMVTKDIRTICFMLYGTSTLIIFRSVFRAVEKFTILNLLTSDICEGICKTVIKHEWFLYAFEAAPMVLYTYWLNIIHPGRFLPSTRKTFLDYEGRERVGPGWIDTRPLWMTFVDPFDIPGLVNGIKANEKFWETPDQWPLVSEKKRQEEQLLESS